MAALDGGLQVVVLIAAADARRGEPPDDIAELRPSSSAPAPGVINVAAYRRKAGKLGVTTDIHFTDEKGQRLAALLGVETHPLPAGSQA